MLYQATTTGLAKVEPDPFEYEHEMRDFVSDNIGVLFPGLEKVKNEMTIKDYRFDTIAYDRNQNTFVVIEYKNKVDKGAVTQVVAYAATIRNHRAELRLAHDGKPNDHKYDWNAVYSIIVAPSFDKVAKDAVQDKGDMELYTIKKYGNRIVAVERAGGGHARPDTPATITHKRSETSVTRESPSTPQMISIMEWVRGIREWKKSMRPTHVTFPDQPTIEVKSWTAIHTKAIEWLIDNDKISAQGQIATES